MIYEALRISDSCSIPLGMSEMIIALLHSFTTVHFTDCATANEIIVTNRLTAIDTLLTSELLLQLKYCHAYCHACILLT